MLSPRSLARAALALSLLPLAVACDPADDDGGGADGSATDAMPTPPANVDPLVVPTNGAELTSWLSAEPYLEWPAESGAHASAGPHFGNVRTWIHPDLEASLEAGNEQHPAGVAAVKELYGDGMTRRGWAVEVKLDDDSQGGDQWYWYEVFDGSTFADGNGLGICTGCHSSGVDFVRTAYPLQ